MEPSVKMATCLGEQSTDLKRFKSLTTGKTIIMGRKTWDSLPSALPNRRNIVMSRRQLENVEQMDFEEILELEEPEICIIGGGEIYRLFLPLTEKLNRQSFIQKWKNLTPGSQKSKDLI